MNGYSEIEREKANLINATSISLEQLEKSKNETLYFEKQRAMNQVRQRVFQPLIWKVAAVPCCSSLGL